MTNAATQEEGVMTGFIPAIHAFSSRCNKDVDGRDKAGHDEKTKRPSLPLLKRMLLALPAAAVSLFSSSEPALAGLKLCNRMSYVVEAAIGIDEKSATALPISAPSAQLTTSARTELVPKSIPIVNTTAPSLPLGFDPAKTRRGNAGAPTLRRR